jgi:hypothetical protein
MKKGQLENNTKKNTLPTIRIFKNSLLFLCLVLLICSGCFKQDPAISENITWKGRVLERGTNKPLSKARVYLYRKTSSGFDPLGGGSGAGALIDSFYTANDGSFSFTYFSDIAYSYSLNGVADGYYLGESEGTLGTRKDPRTDILLDPMAWIKFHVKNVNPYDENDKILVNNLKPLLGNRVDTFLLEQSIGNTKFDIITWYYKNQIKYIIRDSITNLVPHDTTYFEIKY